MSINDFLLDDETENPLEGKGRQRLVKVLASPVRDSQGNVTQVAELIWDAGRDNWIGPGWDVGEGL